MLIRTPVFSFSRDHETRQSAWKPADLLEVVTEHVKYGCDDWNPWPCFSGAFQTDSIMIYGGRIVDHNCNETPY
jgi:hypothetical protein